MTTIHVQKYTKQTYGGKYGISITLNESIQPYPLFRGLNIKIYTKNNIHTLEIGVMKDFPATRSDKLWEGENEG